MLRLNTRSHTEKKLKDLLSALIMLKTTQVDLVSSNHSCFVLFFLRMDKQIYRKT